MSLMLVFQALSMNSAAQTHPVRVWGEFGYDYRLEDFEQQGDVSEHVGLARINAATYIVEPWVATVDGGIGFNVRETDGDRGESNGDQIVGNGTLRLFPQSRFPFVLFAERSDSSTDTVIASTDVLKTVYGLQQSYTAESGGTARLRYEHSETENTRSIEDAGTIRREDVADLLQVGFNKNFGAHGLTFESDLNRVDSVDNNQVTETVFSSLRHTYRPGPTLSAEDLLTVGESTFERETSDLEQDFVQLNSFARWRPARDSKLRVNSTLRVLGRENRVEDAENSLETGTATVGMSYSFTPRSYATASAGGTAVEVDDDESDSTFQTAAVNHTSQVYPLLGFDSTYFGQLNAENNNATGSDSVQTLGAQVGYDISRVWTTGDTSSLQFTTGQSAVGQSAAITGNSEGLQARTLTSSASLNWNQRGQNASSMIGFSLSDSRSEASGEDSEDLEGNFQIANLQASLNQRYGLHSSLSGNLTVQATRNDREAIENGQDTGDGEWRPTAAIDFIYTHRRAFDVPRLSFRSNLRFVSDSYFPGVDEVRIPDGRDDKLWDNRFDYLIGRLQLRLTVRVAEINEEEQALLLFQLRRLFGDNQF